MNAPARIETVQISTLLRDPRFQVRQKLDQQTINRYAAVYSSGRAMPPIKVALVNGAAVVVDGWHRLAALDKLGRYQVAAEIVEASEQEAIWLAAQANLEHGLRLKSPEIRTAFRAYVRAKKHQKKWGNLKSYREIAEELGGLRRYTTIRHWMMKDFPNIAARMGGDETFKDTGGLRDKPTADFDQIAEKALNEALAASRGVECPMKRGRLIKLAESVLTEITDGGPWSPPEEQSDF